MGRGGVGTLRFKAAWRVIEPTPGNYDFSGLDRIIGNAAAQGIRSTTLLGPFVPDG